MNMDLSIRRIWPWPLALMVIIVAAISVYWLVCRLQPTTTVYLARHADKAGPNVDDLDDPLGTDRADKLVHVLGSAGISAVFHSDTTRAQKTAQPLANALSVSPLEYPAAGVEELADEILADHSGEQVFVVGHSDTVPLIVEQLGGPLDPQFDACVYDNLYVVSRCNCGWWPWRFVGRASVSKQKYGAPTPPCS
jgi:phosphohistidine phosphatase SixA